MLLEQPEWSILDSTKVQEGMECLRKFFFREILGWNSVIPNNHLVFGSAWHLAMAHLLENGYGDTIVGQAFDLFLEYYRGIFPSDTDELFSPKTPERALMALLEYATKYKEDKKDFDVLYTEVFGTVLLTEDRSIHFRQDTICRGQEGLFSLEHKTRGRALDRLWADQWQLKAQVGTYAHVLHCLFPNEEIYGVKINGVGFLKTKFSMERFSIVKRLEDMMVWYATMVYWTDLIFRHTEMLAHKEYYDDPVMTCFPMNTESCTNYFGCPYLDFCSVWANPLQHTEVVPIGFEVKFWNPSLEQGKHKVELGNLIS